MYYLLSMWMLKAENVYPYYLCSSNFPCFKDLLIFMYKHVFMIWNLATWTVSFLLIIEQILCSIGYQLCTFPFVNMYTSIYILKINTSCMTLTITEVKNQKNVCKNWDCFCPLSLSIFIIHHPFDTYLCITWLGLSLLVICWFCFNYFFNLHIFNLKVNIQASCTQVVFVIICVSKWLLQFESK